MKEIWKDVPGYEGLYEVGSNGIVRSCDRLLKINRAGYKEYKKRFKGKVISSYITVGYEYVSLWKNNETKHHRVHRLVLATFVGESELDVNHKNGAKTDNRLTNLEYVTRSENLQHAYDTLGIECPVGEARWNSRLTEKQVLRIREMWKSGEYTQPQLANKFGVSRSAVSSVVNRYAWKHI